MKGRNLLLVAVVAIGLVFTAPVTSASADGGKQCKEAKGSNLPGVSHQRGPCGNNGRRGDNHRRPCGRRDSVAARNRCKVKRGKDCRSFDDRGRRKKCKRNDHDHGRDGRRDIQVNPED